MDRAHESLHQTITHQLSKEYADDPRYAALITSPLLEVSKILYYLSFDQRKFIVNCMRIQQPIRSNNYLSRELDKLLLEQEFVHVDRNEMVHFTQVVDWIDMITTFPTTCCILSFLARAEKTIHVASALSLKEETFQKEVTAALTFSPSSQTLDYTCLFHDWVVRPIHWEFPVEAFHTRHMFRQGVRRMKNHFSSRSTPPLLPYCNSRKNLGYATQEAFLQATGGTAPLLDVTTGEILRYYMMTGNMVHGPVEMRIAWFFNDLKPRVYYALGGSAYWHGLHIKEIANYVCTFFPSTNPFSRFNVQRLDLVGPDTVLVTYDYTSFSTTLAELKSFLFWLAQEFRGIDVDVLDVHEGVRTVDLGALIDSYNELVNCHQDVDIRRFCPESFDTIFQQGRNGSLGVQGNIVFSTILHGVSLGGITDSPGKDSCVGDDALFIIYSSLITMMMVCVNHLGNVQLDKYSMMHKPPSDNPNLRISEAFKYLKRPISVDFTGRILEGSLDFFPSLADALFPNGDGIHTAKRAHTQLEVVTTFVTQWGRFLNLNPIVPTDADLYEDDLFIIIALVQTVYNRFGLSFSGQVPGGSCFVEGRRTEGLRTWVPPCDYINVFTEKWMTTLYGRFNGTYVSIPLRVKGEIPAPAALMENEVFEATSSKLLNLLLDLKCLRRDMIMTEQIFDERMLESEERVFRGEKCEVVYRWYMSYIPSWYTDLATYYLPDLITPSDVEVYSEIESIFGVASILD